MYEQNAVDGILNPTHKLMTLIFILDSHVNHPSQQHSSSPHSYAPQKSSATHPPPATHSHHSTAHPAYSPSTAPSPVPVVSRNLPHVSHAMNSSFAPFLVSYFPSCAS